MREFRADRVMAPRRIPIGFDAGRFADGRPLDLEIGCGVGWHPIRYARDNPHRALVAIEKTKAKYARFQTRFFRRGDVSNLHPVHADAVAWVTHFLRPETLERVFLLYPNPNPKNPAVRWFRMPFFKRLLGTIKPGGEVHLASNEAWYVDEAKRFAASVWGLDLRAETRLNRVGDGGPAPRTHFERKYLARGQTCYDAVFVKR